MVEPPPTTGSRRTSSSVATTCPTLNAVASGPEGGPPPAIKPVPVATTFMSVGPGPARGPGDFYEQPLSVVLDVGGSSGGAVRTFPAVIGVGNHTNATVRIVWPVTLTVEVTTDVGTVLWAGIFPPITQPLPAQGGWTTDWNWVSKNLAGQAIPPGDYTMSIVTPVSITYCLGDKEATETIEPWSGNAMIGEDVSQEIQIPGQ